MLRVNTAAETHERSEKRRPRSRLPELRTPHPIPAATNPSAAVAPPDILFMLFVESLFTVGIIVAPAREGVNRFIQKLE
jgi:hypothetical protein